MRCVRSSPSQSSTFWPRGANVIYAVIILSFSAASINSSPSSPSPLKESLTTSPASTTHFPTSQLTISEFTATSYSPFVHSVSPSTTTSTSHPNGIDDASSLGPLFSNQFVLEIKGGEEAAKTFAESRGFIYLGQVSAIVYFGSIASSFLPLLFLSFFLSW